jgi:serine/threonine-protein kinase RsbW
VKSINEQSISVPASTAYISAVRDFVGLYANQFGFNDREVDEIRLAVDEAYTNVIKHAYQFDENERVLIALGSHSDEFWISITDQGRAFDPSKYAEPDIKERIRLKKRGGVGVYLIRRLMDAVEYHNTDGMNEIRMTKRK